MELVPFELVTFEPLPLALPPGNEGGDDVAVCLLVVEPFAGERDPFPVEPADVVEPLAVEPPNEAGAAVLSVVAFGIVDAGVVNAWPGDTIAGAETGPAELP